MILDAAGTFSDNQVFSAVSAGIIQSDNWMDFGLFTDKLGKPTGKDMGAGEPLYVHFRVTSTFSNSLADPAAFFRAVLFTDIQDPPVSTGGTATFLPSSHEVLNQLGVGFTVSLEAGRTFVLPLCSPQGGALNPNNTLVSRAVGQRFLRVAYQFGGTGTFSGAIEAILTKDSMTTGKPNAASKYIGGIYPANVDIGLS